MKSRTGCMVSGAVLALISGLTVAGAQQPMVARAARPALRPVMQVDPGQPEPPQANNTAMKDDLFAGTEKFAKNATDISEISMDPETLGMVGGADAKRAHHMLLSVVRSYTYDKPGMYNLADVEEFRRKIETGDWHCSIHTRDMKSGESTDICSRHPSPDTIENAIITVEPKELTFIHTIKKNDGGGGMNLGIGMDFMGLPPQVSMEVLGPEMRAEMLASAAVMHAQMPALMGSLGELKMEMPKLDSEEMQRNIKEAQRALKEFRWENLPGSGSSPDFFQVFPAVPEVPEVPVAPAAPWAAPGAPAIPAAPAAPSSPATPHHPSSAEPAPPVPAAPRAVAHSL